MTPSHLSCLQVGSWRKVKACGQRAVDSRMRIQVRCTTEVATEIKGVKQRELPMEYQYILGVVQ